MQPSQHFRTWAALEARVQTFAKSNTVASGLELGHYSQLLFRGQADSKWQLDTTLERARPKFTALADYYRSIAVAKTQIETFTSHKWAELDYPTVQTQLSDYDTLRNAQLPAYDYLVYLRHHGFPSPLLDWSRSLYIAAYFAFHEPKGKNVAISVFQEYAGGGKSRSSGEPQIIGMGPNVRSHPRHFLQQGEYTMCCQFKDGDWHFASHSDVFAKKEQQQDRLWKFTIPATQAPAVMKRLSEYNINAYSLFQSEESLLKTLANQLLAPLPR